MFARNLYRYGLLGRFIGLLHVVARLHGKKLERLLDAAPRRTARRCSIALSRRCSTTNPIRFLSKSPISLYALGIPPAQYEELVAAGDRQCHQLLRQRVERLACDFPIQENYFAWQAFGRGYDVESREAVPDYLQADNYAASARASAAWKCITPR